MSKNEQNNEMKNLELLMGDLKLHKEEYIDKLYKEEYIVKFQACWRGYNFRKKMF